MKDQVITDTVTIKVDYLLGTANMSNILHAKYNTPVGDAELDLLNTTIQDWLTADWAPIASSDIVANMVTITDMGSLSGIRKAYPINPTIPGTLVSEAVPPNSTIAVKADVGHRGKGIQGRVFWIGLAETQVDNYVVGATAISDILTAMDNLRADVEGLVPYDGLCVPHLVVGGVEQNPASSELVTRFLVTDNVVDSQRDRLPNHKRRKKPTP